MYRCSTMIPKMIDIKFVLFLLRNHRRYDVIFAVLLACTHGAYWWRKERTFRINGWTIAEAQTAQPPFQHEPVALTM
ncbi:hypothetical protein J1N35_001591 [Gossypium stocksii]|uniref:Uncharacterized protein n=1 Tax=Gossypium stocksii TaxID=47602 RepID=A0A9D3WKN6_9ROSI|nr:hypothetical protein J1N35_001591 [Gossypium stocksii]